MDPLLIQFSDNDGGHDDLDLWIEGYSRTTDSYYLALDRAMLAGDESADKVRRVSYPAFAALDRRIGAGHSDAAGLSAV
jgi:hypothetical protein